MVSFSFLLIVGMQYIQAAHVTWRPVDKWAIVNLAKAHFEVWAKWHFGNGHLTGNGGARRTANILWTTNELQFQTQVLMEIIQRGRSVVLPWIVFRNGRRDEWLAVGREFVVSFRDGYFVD